MGGTIIGIIVWLVLIYLAYTIIKTAVRHGMDSSETHKLLQEIHAKKIEKTNKKR